MASGSSKHNILLNTVFGLLTTAGMFYAIREAGLVLAPIMLGVFLYSRRVADTTSSLLQLGTAYTVRRYVSMHSAQPAVQRSFILMGFLLLSAVVCITAVAVCAIVYNRGVLSYCRSIAGCDLSVWVGLLIVAQLFHYFAASVSLALRRVVLYNALSFLNASGWIILALHYLAEGAEVNAILACQTIGTMVASLFVLTYCYLRLPSATPDDRILNSCGYALGEYVSYGLMRSIVPFLQLLILIVGPWLIRDDMAAVAALIISLSVVRLGQVCILPAASMSAVIIARSLSDENADRSSLALRLIVGVLFYGSTIGLAFLYPWLDELVNLWLADRELASRVCHVCSYVLGASIPFVVFQGLKEPIEMIWKKPLNVLTLLAGLTILVGGYYVFRSFASPEVAVGMSYVACFWSLGLFSLFWVRRLLEGPAYFGLLRLLLLFVSVLALNYLLVVLVADAALSVRIAAMASGGGVSLGLLLLCLTNPPDFVREFVAYAVAPRYFHLLPSSWGTAR